MTEDQLRTASDHDMIVAMVTEQREFRAQHAQDMSHVRRDTAALRSDLTGLINSQALVAQRQTQMEEACRERHRRDSAEIEASRGVAARVEVIERDLQELRPRFDATETSVVTAAAEQEGARKAVERARKEGARLWQLLGLLATIAGAVATYLIK